MSGAIAISPIEPDADPAVVEYVRLIQIYADPPDTPGRRPILELELRGGNSVTGNQLPLEIAVPGGLRY